MHIIRTDYFEETNPSEDTQEEVELDRLQLEELADKVMKLMIRELSLGKEREGKIL